MVKSHYYILLKTSVAFQVPITYGCFMPSLVDISPIFLEEKFFKCRQCLNAIISHWKSYMCMIFYVKENFNSLYMYPMQRCIESTLVEIDPVVLETLFPNVDNMYFRCFTVISPWKGMVLHLNKLKDVGSCYNTYKLFFVKYIFNIYIYSLIKNQNKK